MSVIYKLLEILQLLCCGKWPFLITYKFFFLSFKKTFLFQYRK